MALVLRTRKPLVHEQFNLNGVYSRQSVQLGTPVGGGAGTIKGISILYNIHNKMRYEKHAI